MKLSRLALGLWTVAVSALPASALDTPPYSMGIDVRMAIGGDLTAIIDKTVRQKVLKESAIALLGQQTLTYAESLGRMQIVEAYTEKADGQRLMLDASNILTRDAATGLSGIYQRDAKSTTLIFPDVAVGDTLVTVSRTHWNDRRFAGQFFFTQLLPLSMPYASYRLTVDAPRGLKLGVSVRGEGLTYTRSEAGESLRLVFDYRPAIWSPDEPGAVSIWDRDPLLVISTLKSMTDLGAGYWSSMKGKDIVTPEIQALADDITKGIEGRRAQAEAIELWVKKNIRYVLVYLGASGILPNPAPMVLKNKYGDCKDHVALTAALLKAKGIASQQVLISSGTMYRLAELPVPLFNHVMLYLPEFALYTDPTASTSAFGILPAGSYDKPVLHISEAGGVVARTPPMKAEDHTTTSKTTVTIASDGSVTGETRQISTGVFAASARQTATRIEAQGPQNYALSTLRYLGHAGIGHFEPATPSNFAEPYMVQGRFALNARLALPLVGQREIPFGMPVHKRPGEWPLGQRLANRKADFYCFAATEVEEIAITFADGLPLPTTPQGTRIDTAYFRYRASYALDGRTLKVRRWFMAQVAHQVCSKDIEAGIAEPLLRIMRSLREQMVFASPPQPAVTH
jgi:transglutaminase-like putative cysteine protease